MGSFAVLADRISAVSHRESSPSHELHPAYVWVARHIPLGEGVIEVRYPTLQIGGSTLYAAALAQVPTASGVGSFWPSHTLALWRYFLHNGDAWQKKETATILQIFKVRYVLLYRFGEQEARLLQEMQRNPRLRFIECFEPLPGPSPWPVPICVVEVLGGQERVALLRTSGWSGEESWGVWAEGMKSKTILWVSQPTDIRISIEAFPHCVPRQEQVLAIRINDTSIAEHHWQDCSLWSEDILIPASLLRRGMNDLEFRYAYAARPIDVTQGQNGDARWLSVGFAKFAVKEVEP